MNDGTTRRMFVVLYGVKGDWPYLRALADILMHANGLNMYAGIEIDVFFLRECMHN